ncbi:hypothetical protein VTJ04DRAFT_6378 [Mycothermus thermophilus]|uniref:uncharacterized protein n=1 Tax=Humicola insolens TaxID=85995 RepID=UPI0037441F9E
MAAPALYNKLIPANDGRKNPRVRVPEPARAKVQHAGGKLPGGGNDVEVAGPLMF